MKLSHAQLSPVCISAGGTGPTDWHVEALSAACGPDLLGLLVPPLDSVPRSPPHRLQNTRQQAAASPPCPWGRGGVRSPERLGPRRGRRLRTRGRERHTSVPGPVGPGTALLESASQGGLLFSALTLRHALLERQMLPKWVSSCPCTRGSGGLAQGQGEDVPGSQGWPRVMTAVARCFIRRLPDFML